MLCCELSDENRIAFNYDTENLDAIHRHNERERATAEEECGKCEGQNEKLDASAYCPAAMQPKRWWFISLARCKPNRIKYVPFDWQHKGFRCAYEKWQ